jgi:NAD(P)-dependent dehydrogenase (short-subunit alcohol dehydrogenase family)
MRPAHPRRSRVALIVGASGGLGSALVRELAQTAEYSRVYALSRRGASVEPPHGLEGDPTCPEDLGRVAARLADEVDAIDLMITCVGTLHDGLSLKPEKALRDLDSPSLQRLVHVNAFAPLAAISAFAPLLRRSNGAIAATLSAMVGSIGENRLGGWYAYRMSKAALTMGLRNAAIELGRYRPGPVVVAIHPVTTLTPLSEPFLRNHRHRPPADSARHILAVIRQLGPEDNGRFLNWDGSEIPW